MSFSIPQLFLDNKPACHVCKRRLHFFFLFVVAMCMRGVTPLLYPFAE